MASFNHCLWITIPNCEGASAAQQNNIFDFGFQSFKFCNATLSHKGASLAKIARSTSISHLVMPLVSALNSEYHNLRSSFFLKVKQLYWLKLHLLDIMFVLIDSQIKRYVIINHTIKLSQVEVMMWHVPTIWFLTSSFMQQDQNGIHIPLQICLETLSARYKYGTYVPMATIAPTLRTDLLTILSVIFLFLSKLTRAFELVQGKLPSQYANTHSSSCPNVFQQLKIGNIANSKFFCSEGVWQNREFWRRMPDWLQQRLRDTNYTGLSSVGGYTFNLFPISSWRVS